jgi:hypothetical protein
MNCDGCEPLTATHLYIRCSGCLAYTYTRYSCTVAYLYVYYFLFRFHLRFRAAAGETVIIHVVVSSCRPLLFPILFFFFLFFFLHIQFFSYLCCSLLPFAFTITTKEIEGHQQVRLLERVKGRLIGRDKVSQKIRSIIRLGGYWLLLLSLFLF